MQRPRPVIVERPAPGHYRERATALLGMVPARPPVPRHAVHPPARSVALPPAAPRPRVGQLLLPVDVG